MKSPDIRRGPPPWLARFIDLLGSVAWAIVAGLALLMLVTQCSCATVRLTAPLEWEPVSRYPAGDVRSVVGVPVLLVAGDVAPADGYLLTVEQWGAVLDEVERLSAALSECYSGQLDDRERCTLRVEAAGEALRVARQGQWQALGVGVALGAGACGAAVGAAGLSRP